MNRLSVYRGGWAYVVGATVLVTGGASVAAAPKKPSGATARKASVGPDLPSRAPAGAALATVNGVKLPLSHYLDRLSLRFGFEMRELMIADELVRQEAKRLKVVVTPTDIDAFVRRVVDQTAQSSGGEARLVEDLKRRRGWTLDDYRRVIRLQAEPQVLREKLAERLVKPTEISDEEIERLYQERKSQFEQPESVRIAHILIRRPAGVNSEAAARKRAENILAGLQTAGSKPFEEVARKESEDPSTSVGGGLVPSDILRNAHPFGAAFEAVVFNAEPGLIKQIIQTPLGFHIIRVDKKTPARTLELKDVRVQLRTNLLTERRARELDALVIGLREKARVDTGRY